MPAALSNGSTTITPIALSEYMSSQEGGAILHRILGRREPDVTLRPAELRTGSFTLDFDSEGAAEDARAALSESGAWTLEHTERPSVNMRFIVRRLSLSLSGNGRWALPVSYEEVGG